MEREGKRKRMELKQWDEGSRRSRHKEERREGTLTLLNRFTWLTTLTLCAVWWSDKCIEKPQRC